MVAIAIMNNVVRIALQIPLRKIFLIKFERFSREDEPFILQRFRHNRHAYVRFTLHSSSHAVHSRMVGAYKLLR